MNPIPATGRLFDYCFDLICQRIEEVEAAIQSVQQSANSETKSTAGDKHETARAMAQIEVEMLSRQLSESRKSLQNLQQLRGKTTGDSVGPGSVVVTSQGVFYMSIALGKVSVDGTELLFISPDAPIARALIGKKAGETVTWGGITLTIHRVG